MPTPIKKKSAPVKTKNKTALPAIGLPSSGGRKGVTPRFADITAATAWLQAHRQLLNLKEIGRRINVDQATMSKIGSATPTVTGYTLKLPKRTLQPINDLYKELTTIL